MISQTSEYALRAMVHLAQIGGGPAVAQDISEATKVPLGYLHKILRMLAKANLLVAQRGVGGGFALAKEPSKISVLEVLRASDTALGRIQKCPLGIKGHVKLCALHRMLDEAIATIEDRFGSTTIDDIVNSNEVSRPLCDTKGGRAGLSISAGGKMS